MPSRHQNYGFWDISIEDLKWCSAVCKVNLRVDNNSALGDNPNHLVNGLHASAFIVNFHYLGVHQSGRFIEVQKRELGKDPELLKAEKMSEMNLKKLRVALELIREIAVDAGKEGRLSLVCRDGKLEVYERRNDTGCLPEAFMRQFRART
ncbi:hypothetical protein BT96DRAFT_1038298 [Gymnopus androsaceus JB14]|uniref:Uncharacterized protein n=1 Tax=Gymnopus androsaceus JB14 TaxID=1447944 RepID=A0A6A4HEX1_9AGAR|nr:hypothetical protein BT96DRAFT_1038298 [Gymnopus androsaceus JB14]